MENLKKFQSTDNLGIPMIVTAEEIKQYELGESIRKIETVDERVKAEKQYHEALNRVFGTKKIHRKLIDFGPQRTFEGKLFDNILGNRDRILD